MTKAADVVEGDDVFELDAVAEGSAGCDDGRAQLYACHVDVHVGTFGFGWGGHFADGLAWVGSAECVSGRRASVRTWPTAAVG